MTSVPESFPEARAMTDGEDGIVNNGTEIRDDLAGSHPSPDDPAASRVYTDGCTQNLDSVLMGHREAERDELLERICIDQVRRWRAGQRVPAETYLAKYPAVQRDEEATFELIYGEFLLREERGEPPTA